MRNNYCQQLSCRLFGNVAEKLGEARKIALISSVLRL